MNGASAWEHVGGVEQRTTSGAMYSGVPHSVLHRLSLCRRTSAADVSGQALGLHNHSVQVHQ